MNQCEQRNTELLSWDLLNECSDIICWTLLWIGAKIKPDLLTRTDTRKRWQVTPIKPSLYETVTVSGRRSGLMLTQATRSSTAVISVHPGERTVSTLAESRPHPRLPEWHFLTPLQWSNEMYKWRLWTFCDTRRSRKKTILWGRDGGWGLNRILLSSHNHSQS